MKLLAVLVLPVLVFTLYKHVREREREARYAAIASEIAGRDVSVDCPSFWGRLVDTVDMRGFHGTVAFDEDGRPADSTSLSDAACVALERFRTSNADAEYGCLVGPRLGCDPDVVESAAAVLTLAHEAYHLAGIRSESQTECYALQRTRFAAERLGATPERARAVARFVSTQITPHKPSEYQPVGCHDGSALDLHPGSAVWP